MRTLYDLCQLVVDRVGSDLHLAAESVPWIRVDGRLQVLDGPPFTGDDISRCLQELLNQEQQAHFDEHKEVDCSFTVDRIGRFRCHIYMQRGSAAVALRLIPHRAPSFDELDLPSTLSDLIHKPQGLLLIAGPTGSGKSTTFSAMIDGINRARSAHIVTLEDPIEFEYVPKKSLITQREIGADAPDFHSALKGVLRQDPDVVGLGELRDLETIRSALTVAETGHLTLATVHTNSAIQTLNRLIAVYPPHQQDEVRAQLALVLEGVVSQRLIPCAVGRGRVLAIEVLIPTPAVRNLIREDKIHQIYSIMQTGQAKHGMQTMNQALADLCKRRMITSQVALRSTSLPEELSRLLDRAGGDRVSSGRLSHLRPH
ncbi:MAG: type IV pilus twitching motility protein PilT [Nitrospirales bacterium]